MSKSKALEGIKDYLTLGGMINSEFMDPQAVRDLLLTCRDALEASDKSISPAYDGHINDYEFTEARLNGPGQSVIIMVNKSRPYSAHVWIPWTNEPTMSADLMTIYGRRVMEEIQSIRARGWLLGQRSAQNKMKEALGI